MVGRGDVEIAPREEAHAADRLREAALSVGGCGAEAAWQFPLRQPGLFLSCDQVVDLWDRFHNGRGLDDLSAYLVRQIRLWRPDVIVVGEKGVRNLLPERPGGCFAQKVPDPFFSAGDDAAQEVLSEAVSNALARAADPQAFAAQIELAGLEPWRVKRAYGALPPGRRGGIEVLTAQLAPRLGRSLADAAATARGLVEERFRPAPTAIALRPLAGSPSQGPGGGDLFGGIVLRPGEEARRLPGNASTENLDLLLRIAERRRQTQAILDQADRDPRTACAAAGADGQFDSRPGRRQCRAGRLSPGRPLCHERTRRAGGGDLSNAGGRISQRSAWPGRR